MKNQDEIKQISNLMIKEITPAGGYGIYFKQRKPYASIIWSNGGGWDHVSMCPYKRSHTPTWDEMCRLKDDFFREDEGLPHSTVRYGRYSQRANSRRGAQRSCGGSE